METQKTGSKADTGGRATIGAHCELCSFPWTHRSANHPQAGRRHTALPLSGKKCMGDLHSRGTADPWEQGPLSSADCSLQAARRRSFHLWSSEGATPCQLWLHGSDIPKLGTNSVPSYFPGWLCFQLKGIKDGYLRETDYGHVLDPTLWSLHSMLVYIQAQVEPFSSQPQRGK